MPKSTSVGQSVTPSKLLIFGATGQFGTSCVNACESRRLPYRALSHKDVEISDGDAIRRLIAESQPAAVINATGVVDIGKCELDPARAFAVNAASAPALAAACREAGAVLVQTSTHLVFDGTKDEPYVESDAPRPNSIYAATKLAGEHLALSRWPRTYVARFPTLYGERCNDARGFVEKMMERLRAGEPLRIADDRIDSPTWALDAAHAVLDLIEGKADFGLYHIANPGPVSYYDFVCRLGDLLHCRCRIDVAKDADFPADPPKPLRVPLRSERMDPLPAWDDALRRYVDSLDQH